MQPQRGCRRPARAIRAPTPGRARRGLGGGLARPGIAQRGGTRRGIRLAGLAANGSRRRPTGRPRRRPRCTTPSPSRASASAASAQPAARGRAAQRARSRPPASSSSERLDEEPTPAFTVDVAAAVLEGEILERGNRSCAGVASRGGRRGASPGRPRRVTSSASGGGLVPARRSSANERRATPRAPRGQSSAPTATLMPAPMAMSCTRTSPVRQPSRDEDVEQHDDEHREPGLSDDEVHRARRVGGEEHHDREHDPQPGVVASDRLHQRGCDPEAHERAHAAPGARSRRCPARSSAAPTAPPARPRTRARPRWSSPPAPRARGRGRHAPRCGTAPNAGCSAPGGSPMRSRAPPGPSARRAHGVVSGRRRRRRRSATAASESRRNGNVAANPSTTAAGAGGRQLRRGPTFERVGVRIARGGRAPRRRSRRATARATNSPLAASESATRAAQRGVLRRGVGDG